MSLLVSASMVLGLVPTPALAEMVATPDDADPVVAQMQDEQEPTQPAEDSSAEQTSPAATEEPAPAEDPAPAEGDNPAPAEDPAATEDPAPAEDDDAELFTQDGNDVITPMELNTAYAVNITESGGYWVGSFTVPTDGCYDFYSTNNSADTYGHLYRDQDLTDEMADSDDDGEDNNFLIRENLVAGQTVYLKARQYSNNPFTCTVYVVLYDASDLSRGSISLDVNIFAAADEPPALPVEVTDVEGTLLAEGVDYELRYKQKTNGEWADLNAAPTAAGNYAVYATNCASSQYHGSTNMREYTIYDLTVMEPNTTYTANVADEDGFWVGSFTAPATGPYDFYSMGESCDTFGRLYDSASFAYEMSNDDDSGEDNNFRMREHLDQGQTVYLKVSQSNEPFSCTVCVEPVDVGDLSAGSISLYDSRFAATAEPPAVVDTVWNVANEELAEGTDYVLAYKQLTDDGWIDLDYAPSAVGYYAVYATGTVDGTYRGSTPTREYEIYDPYDMSAVNYGLYFEDLITSFAAGSSSYVSHLYVEYYDYDQNDYVHPNQGTDYELVFRDADDEDAPETTVAPTEQGRYAVYARATQGGAYSGRTGDTFFILYDPNDLSTNSYSLTLSGTSVVYYTGTADYVSRLHLTRYDEQTHQSVELTQGTDYELVFKDANDYNVPETTVAPTEPGSYRVYARATQGGSYSGESCDIALNIFDKHDIGDERYFSHYTNDTTWIDYTGNPIENPTLTLYYHDQELEGNVYLVQGTDFRLAYYTDEDGAKLYDAPSAIGRYKAVYEGIAPYKGTVSLEVRILGDGTDLSLGRVQLDRRNYDYSGSSVDLAYMVYDVNGDTMWSYTHSLVYYDEDGNKLGGAPTQVGTYAVAACGNEDAGYTGETPAATFYICDENNIGAERFSARFADRTNSSVAYTGAPIVLPALELTYEDEDGNSVQLTEGTDFSLDHFEDTRGQVLDQAPTALGEYVAVYAGEGDYTGFRFVTFYVNDPHDLSYATISVEPATIPLEDGVATPQVTVRDLAGNVLTEGTDYVLRYGKNWPLNLTSITEAGYYEVCAFAVAGSGYSGRTGNGSLDVYDPYDVNDSWWHHEWQGSSWIALADTMTLPKTRVYRYEGEGDESRIITLTEGTDYVLDHLEDEDGANVGTALPHKAGEYRAVFKGKDPYHNTFSLSFDVYDPNNIGTGGWTARFWPNSRVRLTDDMQLPMVLVYRMDEQDDDNNILLTEGTDYELVRFEDEYGNDLGATMPTEIGDYYAVYQGKGDYSGECSLSFWVYDFANIGSGLWEADFLKGSDYYTDGGPVELRQAYMVWEEDDKTTRLTEGVDFEFDHFEDYDTGERLDAAPSAPGEYYAVYKGINAYHGTREIWFGIHTSYNLASASLMLSDDTFEYTGDPVPLQVKVRDEVGLKLQEDVDYKLKFYDEHWNQLEGVPKDKGTYWVTAVSVDGSRYVGSSRYVDFDIKDDEPDPGQGSQPDPGTGTDPTSAELHLDESVEVTVPAQSYWVGSFVVPQEGTYIFASEGNDDMVATLYADEGLDDSIDDDDDGGTDFNFRIMQRLEANQTVYLKVRGYGNAKVSCTVSVTKRDDSDLSLGYVAGNGYITQGDSLVPVLGAYDVLDQKLTAGTDFEWEYGLYNSASYDYVEADGFDEPGEYRVRAVATDGGSYKKQTSWYYCSVMPVNDLAGAGFELSRESFEYTGAPVELQASVTDRAGNLLTVGTDYELVYYATRKGVSTRLDEAPTEVGEYWVVAVATDDGDYYGRTGSYNFSIYDPYDLSTYGSAIFLDDECSADLGDEYVSVYRLAARSVEPNVVVYCGGECLDEDNYSLSYARNDLVSTTGDLATVTVTGKAPYKGSFTKEFMIVDKYDLSMLVRSQGLFVTVNGAQSYESNNGDPVFRFKTDEGGISPRVAFVGFETDAPVQGRDFTVSFATVDGKAIDTPSEEGKYKMVLTATEDGNCKGVGSLRFVLSSSSELSWVGQYPELHDADSYPWEVVNPDEGVPNTNIRIHETLDALGQLWLDLYDLGMGIVENLDYTVDTFFDEVGNYFTYLFSGINDYEGSVRAVVYISPTKQIAFSSRDAGVGDRVYKNAKGILQAPERPYVEGLSYGADFTFAGYVDADGNPISTASAGDAVYALYVGAGDYAGTERRVACKVSDAVWDNEEPCSIASALVSVDVLNGVRAAGAEGEHWYVLRGTDPQIRVELYDPRKTVVLDEDNGFTAAVTGDQNEATVTLTADPEGPLSGSRGFGLTYVDAYDLASLCSMVVAVDATGTQNRWSTSTKLDTNDLNAMRLSYAGVDYLPTITCNAGGSAIDPSCVAVTLRDATGARLDAITGPGAYLLEVEGTGDWTGGIQVPLDVVPYGSAISLATCELSLTSEPLLEGGVAEPGVQVLCGGVPLQKDKDYTVAYGSNTEEGKRGWVKVTAVKDSGFCGSKSANFVVGPTAKLLRRADYVLQLRSPADDEWYDSNTQVRTYVLESGATTGPAVQVCEKRQDGSLAPIGADCYTVEYGGLDESGLGYVRVKGANGYTGTLTANFYVIASSVGRSTIALENQTKTYNGEAQPYDGPVTRTGSTGAVTFAYYSNAACTKPVAAADVKGVGTYYVVATLAADDEYRAATSAPVTITIRKATSTIALEPQDVIYDGEAKAYDGTVTRTGSTGAVVFSYFLDYACTTPVAAEDVRGAGMYYVVATLAADDNYEGATSATSHIHILRANSSIAIEPQEVTYDGEAHAYEGAVTKSGSTGNVTYSYWADAGLSTMVDPSDVKGAATYYVVAALDADANYNGATSEKVELVIRRAGSTIALEAQEATYDGEAHPYEGAVTRTGSTGKVTYAYFSDAACTKSVAASDVKGAGTYYVVATLAADANYEGATSALVTITIHKATSTIAIAPQTKPYTGVAQAYNGTATKTGSTGAVTYAYFSEAACTDASAVAAADVVARGTYYVKATLAADANYEGATSEPTTLTITKGTSTIALEAQKVSFDGEPKAYGGTVSRTGSTGAVTFAYFSDAACTTPVAAEDVVAVGTYYVVATLAADDDYEGATSSAVAFTIRPSVIDISGALVGAPNQTYTGAELKPVPTITCDGDELDASLFDVSYDNNTNAGKATITVTAKADSGYEGSASGSFVIDPADLSGATIANIPGRAYDGKPYEPEPRITLGGRTLTKGVDYTLSYDNNRYASVSTPKGHATLTATGIGNYTGTATATFLVWKNYQPMTARAVERSVEWWPLRSAAQTVACPLVVAHAVSIAKPLEYVKKGGDACLSIDPATGEVTVRKGTDVGTYHITIRVIAFGGANYNDGSCMEECTVRVVDSRKANTLSATTSTATAGSYALQTAAVTVAPISVSGARGAVSYRKDSGASCLSVSATTGKVTVAKGTKDGTYTAKVSVTAAGDATYRPATKQVTVTVKVADTRKANPLKVTAKAATLSAATLKAKALTVALLTVSDAKGAVSYKKESGSAALTVSTTTGKVSVRKGTQAGTYSAKVSVTAAGDATYKPGSKSVTIKVTVG